MRRLRCELADSPYTLTASKLDPSAVDADDIIGGVDISGNKSGLELVDDVFPLFRVVPGTLIAPGFSSSPSVAAVMAAKCTAINTVFKAICAVEYILERTPKSRRMIQ